MCDCPPCSAPNSKLLLKLLRHPFHFGKRNDLKIILEVVKMMRGDVCSTMENANSVEKKSTFSDIRSEMVASSIKSDIMEAALYHIHNNKPLTVETDASGTTIAASLSQE
ncbi:hypothetical protein GJ496_011864 [Pomphorhynchus laevis]|nr:hypothetical protein GJ496_011864 [Pomphorhynchus laevis]